MRLPRVRFTARRILLELGAVVALLGLTLTAAVTLRGCRNQHSRPGGHADMSFAVAPAGDHLAFNAVGAGGRDLYLLDLRDRRVTRIAETPDYEVDPVLSPDGESIAYAAGQPGERADHLFIRPTRGGPARQLTSADANDSAPAFSPDGSRIAFVRHKTHQWGGLGPDWADAVLCLIRADASGVRQLTADGAPVGRPHFSADGGSVWYVGEDGLYTAPIDGSRPPVKSVALPAHDAAYSPEGGWLALTMGRYGPDVEVFVTPISPLRPVRATHLGRCHRLAFSPDGASILFLSSTWPTGLTGVPKSSIWRVGRDGTGQRRIADYGLFDDPTHWRPPPEAPARSP